MKDKRKKIELQINEFIKSVLTIAEKEQKLDHINIEINNHNGNLQMDYTFRDRKKAY